MSLATHTRNQSSHLRVNDIIGIWHLFIILGGSMCNQQIQIKAGKSK